MHREEEKEGPVCTCANYEQLYDNLYITIDLLCNNGSTQ